MPTTEQISFEGPLGTLRGMLHRPDGVDPTPAVMLLHGFTGQHIESDRLFVQVARALADAGFAALRFDFYGSGDSDGDFEEFTLDTELADACAGFDWLSTQSGIDPNRIGVVGLSLGGAIAALLAGQEPRVKTTVLWNAVASTREMSEKLSAGPYGGLVLGEALLESMRAADPAATIRQATGPVLIIAATGDTVVLPPAAEAYAASLGGKGTLRWFEGGDHTFQHPDWRRTLFAWTIDWFRQQLG
jgi:dienelactone hydrolase